MNYVLSWIGRAGSVRRVLRRGDQHVCGLCRSEYSALTLAHSCVVRCWAEFLGLQPVIARGQGKRVSYRCRLCARDHSGMEKAESCARACRARLGAAFEIELGLVEIADDLPAEPPKRTKPLLRLVVIQGPRSKKRPQLPLLPDEGTGAALVAEDVEKTVVLQVHADQKDTTSKRDAHGQPGAAAKAAKAG